MKLCVSCGIVKEFAAFAKNSKHSDGRASYCRPCQAIYTKVWREKNAARIRVNKAADYAANREARKATIRAWAYVNPEKKAASSRRWENEHRDYYREYKRNYVDANKAAVKEYKDRWVRKNPERRRVASLNSIAKRRTVLQEGMEATELQDWLSYQLMQCAYCGVNCAFEFHIDHFVPIARGGLHEHENLRIACPTCNLRKNARDPYEFMESLRGTTAV